MEKIKKLILTPYFGDLPEWFLKFRENVRDTLYYYNYEWYLDMDLDSFKKRVREKLGIEYPAEYGSPKIWDYRCALGYLYEEQLVNIDYWVTMDMDIVFGDVNKFFPDEELMKWDIWSNHGTYVAGFWSLYRNCKEVNELFMQFPTWKEIMSNPKIYGWVEKEYSRLLEASGLRYKYSSDLQGDPYHPPFNLKKEDGRLYQDGIEIPLLHFRRLKKWPL